MATAIGIVNNCFGLLIVPACRELGLTRQAMAGNQTMLNLGAMVVALGAGKIFRPNNLRRLMCIGATLMCIFYFLFAAVRSLPAFYLVALAVGLAQGMVNVIPFAILIGNWFVEKRGFALGLTYMGSGLGGMLFNIIGGRLVESIGWRGTVLVFGGILCAVILPLVFFVIQAKPADIGLRALGEGTETEAVPPAADRGIDTAFLRRSVFYIVGLDITIAAMAVNGIASTSTPYYTDLFSSGVVGANLASAFMASLAAGKLALGTLYDKLGCFRATLLSRVLLMLSLFFLALGRNTAFIILFLLCAGLAGAANSVSIPFLANATVPESGGVSITGVYSGLQSLGSLLAPVVCGWICDVTGSYATAYRALLVTVAFMLLPMLWSLRTKSRHAGIKA